MNIEEVLVKHEHPITKISKRLLDDLITNRESRGGRLCIITGEQGSGKTTMLRRLAEAFLEQDTIVIWRGRQVEQVHWIPNWKERCTFWHWSRDEFKAYDVRGAAKLDITDELDVRTYDNPPDLLSSLEHGKLNVVYEPSTFYFTKSLRLLDVIRKSAGLKIARKAMNQPHEGELIWFELFYLLVTRMDTYWYAVLLDEADDIFPESPQDLRWKLQEWAKNILRDLRKTRTNLVMCTHALSDMDYRIRSKIQFWIYMRNAKIPETSVIKKKELTCQLSVGQYIIENGYFGVGWVAPYKMPDMGDLRIVITPREEEEGEEEDVNDR